MVGDTGLLDPHTWIDAKTVLVGELGNLSVGILAPDQGEKAQGFLYRLHAQDNILGDRIILNQLEVLVNHTDSQGCRIPGGAELHLLASDSDFALVGPVKAEENVHQGGLAGPIFTQDRENFTLSDSKRNIVIG